MEQRLNFRIPGATSKHEVDCSSCGHRSTVTVEVEPQDVPVRVVWGAAEYREIVRDDETGRASGSMAYRPSHIEPVTE